MKTYRWLHISLLFVMVLLSASCSMGSGPSDEDLEDPAEDSMEEFGAEGFWGQTFNFSMTGDLGQIIDPVQDSMETEWAGTFTVDENGVILGAGTAVYYATIFNDDNGCGYVWFETEDFDFILHGQAQQREGKAMFSLEVELASDLTPVRDEPVATCDDPGDWRLSTPEMYFELHRDIMLTDIQLGLASLGSTIEFNQTLETQTSRIDYTILVDLAAVPLTD